jgi:hypothetical protein
MGRCQLPIAVEDLRAHAGVDAQELGFARPGCGSSGFRIVAYFFIAWIRASPNPLPMPHMILPEPR